MKKSLSLLLAIALVFGAFASMAFAADTAPTTLEKFNALKTAGIFTGVDADGTPALDQKMTRAQFARAAGLLLGKDVDAEPSVQTFTDVPKNHWAYQEVEAAVAAGLMIGVGGGKFNPSGNLKVEDLAIVLANALGLKKVDGATVAGADAYAVGYIKAVTDAGIALPTNYKSPALRSDLVDASYQVWIIVSVKVVSAKAIDATHIEVMFSDNAVAQKFDVAALTANKEETRKVTYKGQTYDVKVTLATIAKIASATPVTNTRVDVALSEAVKAVNAADFSIVDESNKALAVSSAKLSGDGLTVTLTTAAQVPAALYTVKANSTTALFVGQVANTNKLQVTSAQSNNNVEVTLTFSANVGANALTAANYQIDNGLTVAGVSAGTNANQVVLTTSAQATGKLYKVTVANVTDIENNALDSNATLAYFGGKSADVTGPTAQAFSDTNTRFKVKFTDSSALDTTTLTNAANYQVDGGLTISKVEMVANSTDTVQVTTSAQTSGKLYTVTLNNIADKFGNKITASTTSYFGGRTADTASPTAFAGSGSNTTFTITYNDASNIDAVSAGNAANYSIDGGLTVKSVSVSANVVTVTTSAQTSGKLYTVTINNVADEYGNKIAANTNVYFGGKAVNSSAPTFTAVSTSNNSVDVTFAAVMDTNTIQAYDFKIDGGLGYALKVVVDSSTKVTLTTLPQVNGKIYTVTANNVTNSDGTAIAANSTATFAGQGTASSAAPKLLAAVAQDNANVVLTFDSALATVPTVQIQTQAGGIFGTTGTAVFSNADHTQVTVPITVATYADGTLYKAVVTGGAIGTNGVAVAASSSVMFAGVSTAPTGARVLAAVPVSSNVVKVVFDKAVTLDATDPAATKASIQLFDQAGTTAVKYNSTATPVSAQLLSLSSDGKELTVYLNKTGATLSLTEGTIYTIMFANNALVTSSGQKLIADASGGITATVKFAATNTASAAPKVLSLVPQSKYVVDMVFDKPVQAVGAIKSALAISGTNMPVVSLVKLSPDNLSARLYLDETGGHTALVEGNIYTVVYTPNNSIYFADAVDGSMKVDLGAATSLSYNFAALRDVAAGPAIAGITNVNANTINVTLDQEYAGTLGVAIGAMTGLQIVPVDTKTFLVVKTDGVFAAGTSYTINLLGTVKDLSSLRTSDPAATKTFGGTSNVNLVAAVADNAGQSKFSVTTYKTVGGTTALTNTFRVRAVSDGSVKVADTASVTESSTPLTTTGGALAAGAYILEATDGSVAITVVHP